MTELLKIKVERSLRLIKSAAGKDVVEICYSGGKDSDVILELAKMAGINYRAIYRCTTVDPPGTIKHVLENGVEIMRPKESFLRMVAKHGMPTRRVRFCCSELKEYKVLDKAILGIRTSESIARSKRYSNENPVVCRLYGGKCNHVSQILPILSWTNHDVEEFIKERNIKCHPLYYDDKNVFHVERRLGCLGCPMKSDRGIADFKAYPKLFKALTKSIVKWWNEHPNTSSRVKFSSAYGLIAHNLFYDSYFNWKIADDNFLCGKMNWKEVLEDYFKIKLQ